MAKQDMDGYATETENLNSIEVEDSYSPLTTSIRKMISEFPTISADCCIYRAPKRFRQFNEKAFTPLLVSIGPFHHGREDLQFMEKLKVGYLDAFLSRANISLETCIKLIKEWENRVRTCYADPIEFTSDDFVQMILLDSCFVIEVIWRYNNVNYLEKVTDHRSHPRIVLDVMLDMILLENQLPFFVLEGLFNLTFPNSISTNELFINLCVLYFGSLLLSGDSKLAMENISRQRPSEIKHLLDLFRMCHAPSISRQNPRNFPQDNSIWSATGLEEAGMVIKSGPNHRTVTDICYTTGVLAIPKLRVDSSSERVLRNLIVLESCLYYHESYISDYIHFMDSLIDTSKDVELLIRHRIIESFTSNSNEVATFLNNLRPYCILSTYIYYGTQERVNAYCNVPWHKWRATLKRDYLSSPWIIASTIAAMVLLILTLVQTVFSII